MNYYNLICNCSVRIMEVVYMKYNQRLRDLREDRDLKQEAVAIELGITRQQYQLYESGKRSLPIEKLINICKFYNVSADYVLGFTNEVSKLPPK